MTLDLLDAPPAPDPAVLPPGLQRLVAPLPSSPWDTDATSCWQRCETGAAVLLFDPTARRMRMVEVTRDRLKDCAECRMRRWDRREGRWLRHLWIADDPMWEERLSLIGHVPPQRPEQLWVGWAIPPSSAVKMRETRNAREKARGEPIDYFTVVFEDGTGFTVASEDLSPRERLLAPYPPDAAWEMLRAAYTCEHVRRHEARLKSKGWKVPGWFEGGVPPAAPERLREAVKQAGYESWTVPEGIEWREVAEDVEALLAATP